ARRRLGDEDRSVRIPPQALYAAPLVRRPPVVGQPELALGSDAAAELDQRICVRGCRRPHNEPVIHAETTMPCPPRRGSPAAARVPSGSISTAETPPK